MILIRGPTAGNDTFCCELSLRVYAILTHCKRANNLPTTRTHVNARARLLISHYRQQMHKNVVNT